MQRKRISALFQFVLRWYPRELRECFGEEMTLVFEEQLAEAQREGGVIGVARVVASVIREAVSVGLPNRLAPVAVPAIAVVTTLIWFVGVLGLIHVAHN